MSSLSELQLCHHLGDNRSFIGENPGIVDRQCSIPCQKLVWLQLLQRSQRSFRDIRHCETALVTRCNALAREVDFRKMVSAWHSNCVSNVGSTVTESTVFQRRCAYQTGIALWKIHPITQFHWMEIHGQTHQTELPVALHCN